MRDYVKCINTKSSAKGAAATHHHVDAMHIEDLIKLIMFSKSKCLCEQLEKNAVSAQELTEMIKHGMMHAFLVSGFMLWMR